MTSSHHDIIEDSRYIDLDADVRSAAIARAFVRETLDEWGRSETEPDACLAVSELVTNSVVHAHSATRVKLVRAAGVIHLEVFDCSDDAPVLYDADLGDTGHRGMKLVESVSDRWGIKPTSKGKVVWIDLTDH